MPSMIGARRSLSLLLACPFVLASGARAQTDAWTNTAEIYVLGAGLSGTTGVGPVEVKVSATFDQILNNLDFGAMANYRGESPTFAVAADVMYTSLGTTVDGPAGEANVSAKEWLITASASFRLSGAFEVLGGLRLTSLDNTVVQTGITGVERTGSLTKTWVDPVVGARVKASIGKSFSLVGYGDIGGFGVGSDFTWMVQARVNWQISRAVGVGLGYRILYQDYESGSGADAFKWNVTTQGPLAALGFRF